MIISDLKLKNYRNYIDLNIKLNKNINIFIGDNAQGKTNILEAIYVLGLTKSFLNVSDKDLINKDSLFAKVEGNIFLLKSNKKMEVFVNQKEKKVRINNNDVGKISDYISNLNVIIFSPDTFIMLKDGPNARRKYFDIEISQIDSVYLKRLINFNLILKQRNEYLKYVRESNNLNNNYIDVLNKKYATLAVDIYLCRKKYIDNINDKIAKKFNQFFKDDELQLKYISNIDYLEDKELMINKFIDKLIKNQIKEINYKQSIYGPNRDEVLFLLNDKNIIKRGSQGQIKIALFVLKLVEIEIFNMYKNEYPILLLDDIFSELDNKKMNLIMKKLPSKLQIIVTTPNISNIDNDLLNESMVFRIKNGKVLNVNKRRNRDYGKQSRKSL